MKLPAFALISSFVVFTSAASLAQGYPTVPVLSDTKTVIGEDLVYPAGKPKVTISILTMAPGEKTIEHQHGIPLAAYIMEGELTVDYGLYGKRIYKQGQALLEAMNVQHVGVNTGTGLVRILAVYMGAEGTPNMVPKQ